MSRPVPDAESGPDLSRLRIPREQGGGRAYRSFPWFGLLVVVALGGVAWLFRGPLLGAVQTATATEVRTARVRRVVPGQAEEGNVAANGYVIANRIASLATVLSGRLVELHAEEGDTVEENAVVARIQYDDIEAQWAGAKDRVAVAVAQVEAAAADVESAKLELPRLEALIETQQRLVEETQETLARLERDVERSRPLFESRRIDEGTWDRLLADARAAGKAHEAAQARVRAAAAAQRAWRGQIGRREAVLGVARAEEVAARQDVEVAEIQVEKTRIRAPFRGLVIRKDAELGEVIAPTGAGNSRGSVFTIVDPMSLEVQVELSERRIQRVAEGDRAMVFLDADPDTGHPARVRKIWPRADRSKGTIEVRVVFDELPAEVRPEMAARVVFQGEEEPVAGDPYLTVPTAAVRLDGDTPWVFVVQESIMRRRRVVVGIAENGQTVIASGLDVGEIVVIDPPGDVEDGARVRVRSEP
ncbi:MAG: efflux RND transporter periplasmic adaptor subunit [Planctomycetota bacterium]|jgi:RND family efflux transporter MFP subunit